MKAGRIIGLILFLVLGVAWLSLGSIPSAYASDFLGEFCFQSQVDGTIYRLAVTDMGESHFLVNGRTTAVNGDFFPVHGNAEVGQEAIELTLNGGRVFSGGVGTGVTISFNLDLVTLNGSGIGIATAATEGAIATDEFTDVINFVACP